jgi:hypothetical protein
MGTSTLSAPFCVYEAIFTLSQETIKYCKCCSKGSIKNISWLLFAITAAFNIEKVI